MRQVYINSNLNRYLGELSGFTFQQLNSNFILKHSEESINSSWLHIRCDYSMITKRASNISLQFFTSYLWKVGFSVLPNVKTETRLTLLNKESIAIVDQIEIKLRIKIHQAKIWQ